MPKPRGMCCIWCGMLISEHWERGDSKFCLGCEIRIRQLCLDAELVAERLAALDSAARRTWDGLSWWQDRWVRILQTLGQWIECPGRWLQDRAMAYLDAHCRCEKCLRRKDS